MFGLASLLENAIGVQTVGNWATQIIVVERDTASTSGNARITAEEIAPADRWLNVYDVLAALSRLASLSFVNIAGWLWALIDRVVLAYLWLAPEDSELAFSVSLANHSILALAALEDNSLQAANALHIVWTPLTLGV